MSITVWIPLCNEQTKKAERDNITETKKQYKVVKKGGAGAGE